eukprot:m.183344 g.183344  ORF g.183344 m.183344 type:complete len:109 (-) comp16650_c0_seq3:352-678(-)
MHYPPNKFPGVQQYYREEAAAARHRARILDRQSGHDIFAENNLNSHKHVFDLHGLKVEEALDEVKSILLKTQGLLFSGRQGMETRYVLKTKLQMRRVNAATFFFFWSS